jgi:hypothetical protein
MIGAAKRGIGGGGADALVAEVAVFFEVEDIFVFEFAFLGGDETVQLAFELVGGGERSGFGWHLSGLREIVSE